MPTFSLHWSVCFYVDINECASNPCLNGGSCTDQVNGYVCDCGGSYTGINCQTGKYNTSYTSLAITILYYLA